MRVIGFNFKEISIEKKKEINNELKINTNIDVKDLKKEELDLFKDKDIFNLEYEFKILYEPDFAELVFKGGILVLIEDKKLVKNIEKQWKDKKIIPELKVPILNLIFSKCNLKALQLEEDMGLPPHIPSPRIGMEPTEDKKQEKQE